MSREVMEECDCVDFKVLSDTLACRLSEPPGEALHAAPEPASC